MTRERDGPSTDGGLQTARLLLSEMNCPWSARRIADAIEGVDGVVETSLRRSEAVVVRYDPTRTSEAALTAAVEQPGSRVDRDSTRTRSGRRSGGCQCRCRDQPRWVE